MNLFPRPPVDISRPGEEMNIRNGDLHRRLATRIRFASQALAWRRRSPAARPTACPAAARSPPLAVEARVSGGAATRGGIWPTASPRPGRPRSAHHADAALLSRPRRSAQRARKWEPGGEPSGKLFGLPRLSSPALPAFLVCDQPFFEGGRSARPRSPTSWC